MAKNTLSKPKPKTFLRLASIFTSAPLVEILGIGLVYLACDESSFDISYSVLFGALPAKAWGVICIAIAFIGFAGFFTKNVKLWRLSHRLIATIFCAMGTLFALQYFVDGIGRPTAIPMYFAGLGQAIVIFTGFYDLDPFDEIGPCRQ